MGNKDKLLFAIVGSLVIALVFSIMFACVFYEQAKELKSEQVECDYMYESECFSLPPDWLFKSQMYQGEDLPKVFIGTYSKEDVEKLEKISKTIGLFGTVPVIDGPERGKLFQVFVGTLGYADFAGEVCDTYPELCQH